MKRFFALLLGLLPACGATDSSKTCTLMACNNGFDVDFSFREKGAYVLEVTVDGVETTCRRASRSRKAALRDATGATWS